MPWCLACRSEYDEGRTTCSDCGAALVDELPPEAPAPVVILHASNPIEAQIAEATLEAAGIRAHIHASQSIAPYIDTHSGESYVIVAAADADRALAVLRELPLSDEEMNSLAESATDSNV